MTEGELELRGRDLRAVLPQLTLRDEHRFGQRLDQALRGKAPDPAALDRLAAEIGSAHTRFQARAASVPQLRYPADLPITARHDDLLTAIEQHQVTIVAGETGSGKTTQLPKICLELGRGVRGMIGHTQPRRIAARSVAERIAEELAVPLGDAVGFTVRFNDQISDATLVRLMTDGILLAEIQQDRLLRRYDTLIIDEAHERSLTIDFLLGYLKQLLPRRPDLKVIITSATIDPQAFSRHFSVPGRPAPVVEVSGRSYPVEIRYRPLVLPGEADDAEPEPGEQAANDVVRDQIEAICEAVDELAQEPPGDVLVFLSGEREIRDTADALNRRPMGQQTEVLPLYGRLSSAEQHRVFSSHTGRRIVLATNVAETSLTVPGIRYVVDPGTARISRYSQRTKVQRLPIEPISQASAGQRAGRCGRVADGICIRLYSESDFEARPRFTEPEILRTNLASVMLQMAALGLGDIAKFGFLDPPDARQIKDGVQLLQELGALAAGSSGADTRLTPVGRTLARLPVDPRLARMLVESGQNGCLDDVLVIVSALAIQDVRERPMEKQQAADQSHARFADPDSDFIATLNLWHYLADQQADLSSNQFRRLCIREFLHHQRIREWQDLHGQLRSILRGAGFRTLPPDRREDARGTRDALDVPEGKLVHPRRSGSQRDAIHLSLLSGLLSRIGLKDGETREYFGARSAKFVIQPGSALFRATPRWVMVAELVETTRLWGRTAARIDPLWAERLAGDLVKRNYSEPRWERKRGAAVATERVTLFGIPLVAARTVQYGSIDPELSRELFIRRALVEGDWRTNHRFFHENRRLLDDVEDLEDRTRRRDILVDDDTLFDFYDQRLPGDIVSVAHFDSWWKYARRERPDQLSFWTSMLMRPAAPAVDPAEYPDTWQSGDLTLPVTYQFEPGTAADGVTVHVPLDVLNQLDENEFEWQIPGLRLDLVTALIRALPKELRKRLAPAPDHARSVLALLEPRTEPLLPALSDELFRMADVEIPLSAWDLTKVPGHLRITVAVEHDGAVVAEGKDLAALREQTRPRVQAVLTQAVDDVVTQVAGVTQWNLTQWSLDELPRTVEITRGGRKVQGFPALEDTGHGARVVVLDRADDQVRAMRAGTRRLLLLAVPSPARSVLGRLDNRTKLALASAPHASPSALFDDCLAAAVDQIVAGLGGPAWDRAGYERLLTGVRAQAAPAVTRVMEEAASVLARAREVHLVLKEQSSPAVLSSLADVRDQLAALVFPGFVTATGADRLADLDRYLQAMQRRLDKLAERPDRDRVNLAILRQVQEQYDTVLASLPAQRRADADVQEVRWMLEELRVSLFGGGLRTAYPVSPQRISKALATLPG
jgi:ATP-dependent helicase HrpA